MVSSTTDDPTSSRSHSGSGPFPAVPVDSGHVVVPLDGSPYAERALPVAGWVAAVVDGDVHLVEVVPSGDQEGAENATRYLDSACRHHRAASWDVVQRDDIATALTEAVVGVPGRSVCMATHGQGRSATVGSVAVSLLERIGRPLILVGPAARPVTALDAPVVVAVDGTSDDERLVPVALGWASRLARRLEIVTVADVPAGPGETARGPRTGPPGMHEQHVESLAARARGGGIPVRTQVVHDAINVRDGLVPLLDRTAALVVIGSRGHTGGGVMAPGSRSARIVHDTAVPAIVVPLDGDA